MVVWEDLKKHQSKTSQNSMVSYFISTLTCDAATGKSKQRKISINRRKAAVSVETVVRSVFRFEDFVGDQEQGPCFKNAFFFEEICLPVNNNLWPKVYVHAPVDYSRCF